LGSSPIFDVFILNRFQANQRAVCVVPKAFAEKLNGLFQQTLVATQEAVSRINPMNSSNWNAETRIYEALRPPTEHEAVIEKYYSNGTFVAIYRSALQVALTQLRASDIQGLNRTLTELEALSLGWNSTSIGMEDRIWHQFEASLDFALAEFFQNATSFCSFCEGVIRRANETSALLHQR
jgi:hypothetical protein